MKIGLVLSSTPGYSETFFRYMIKGLIDSGHNVVLFCRSNDKDFNLCDTYSSPRRYKNIIIQVANFFLVFFTLIPYLNKVLRFYRFERETKKSIPAILTEIYFNANFFKVKLDWLHFGFGTLAIGRENIPRAIEAKMAVSFRGFDIGVYPIKYPGCYNKLWKTVDKIHVISNDIHDLLYKNGYTGESPVVKITPAIDTSFFSKEKKTNTQIKNPVRIITIARLHWKKGLGYTLEALSLLKVLDLSFKYFIIGEGEEYESLKYSVSQLDLEDCVEFLGKCSPEEVRSQMLLSDIYIQYSLQEGFCNAVLEAQAMGLLCVVSDAEGLSENVLNQRTGWVVPKRNSKELAVKLFEVINLDEDEKNNIRKEARDRVLEYFGIDNQNKSFNSFYTP